MAAFSLSSLSWRVGVVAVFFLSQAALLAANLGAGDTWIAVTGALVIPALVGFLIARPWVLSLALTPFGLFLIDSDTTDVSAGFAIASGVVMYLACLAIGIAFGRAAGRGCPTAHA